MARESYATSQPSYCSRREEQQHDLSSLPYQRSRLATQHPTRSRYSCQPPTALSQPQSQHNKYSRHQPGTRKPQDQSHYASSAKESPYLRGGETPDDNAPKEETEAILRKRWGLLFDSYGSPTKKLEKFLRGLAYHLVTIARNQSTLCRMPANVHLRSKPVVSKIA